jgi:hypothetical protein
MQTRYAWLAGVIDGEGSLSIWRRKTYSSGRNHAEIICAQAGLSITNSSAALLDECRVLLDALGVKYSYITPGNSVHRPIRRIFVRNYASVLKLLDAVEPHMVGKREQAALLREFVTRAAARKGFVGTEERLGYCARMSALNQTGDLIP